jgi:hypothetical protein
MAFLGEQGRGRWGWGTWCENRIDSEGRRRSGSRTGDVSPGRRVSKAQGKRQRRRAVNEKGRWEGVVVVEGQDQREVPLGKKLQPSEIRILEQ